MFSVRAPFDAKADLIEKYRSRINPQDPQRSATYAAMIKSTGDTVDDTSPTSNGGKASTFEDSVRVLLVVVWPGEVTAELIDAETILPIQNPALDPAK